MKPEIAARTLRKAVDNRAVCKKPYNTKNQSKNRGGSSKIRYLIKISSFKDKNDLTGYS